MKRYQDTPHLVVSAFAYFMANVWGREVANDIFGMVMGDHFFAEWCKLNDFYKSADAASMALYFKMSGEYRKKLVDTAMQHYCDGEWINYQ